MSTTSSGVALVTGASSGIGLATAKALANAGFRVFGTGRSVAAERSDGITILTCDVTDDESETKVVERVLAEAGRIDLLVNNAEVGTIESSTLSNQVTTIEMEDGQPVITAVTAKVLNNNVVRAHSKNII